MRQFNAQIPFLKKNIISVQVRKCDGVGMFGYPFKVGRSQLAPLPRLLAYASTLNFVIFKILIIPEQSGQAINYEINARFKTSSLPSLSRVTVILKKITQAQKTRIFLG